MSKISKKINNGIGIINGTIEKYYVNIRNLVKFALYKRKFGINTDSRREENIIISLTSFPARMDKIHLCLKSLLIQTLKPDKIVVYLGKDEFTNIELPNKVCELMKYGVEFRFVEDLKPHTKYYYAIQEFPNSIVITVDDDVYYEPHLVEDLYKYHTKFPHDVICTRAHKMKIVNSKLVSYNAWEFETRDVGRESHLFFATGVGGVLYPVNCLCEETFNVSNIKKLSLRQDDVWLKMMEVISKTKVFIIPPRSLKYVIGIWNSEKITLNSSNVGQNKNDIYISNVMTEYNIKSDDFLA